MSNSWPLPERFCLRLTFDSDWHVGSGMGRPGNVDRLVIRDSDDLPYVPAKTLRGIWRDACERLCRGLDGGQLGAWSRLVDWLFGSQPALGPADPTGRHSNPAAVPLASAVRLRPLRFPLALRSRLARADRRLRQALTFVKPGVKIDRRSGSAQTDFLRFEEVARKGSVLEAECRLVVAGDQARQLASALLIASARLVERLGGKRRRGTGRCRLEIVGADVQQAIRWLQAQAAPPQCPAEEAFQPSPSTPYTPQQNDPWVRVPLELRLLGPLAISFRTTGNVVESLDFLPGTYLLPHITRTLQNLGVDVRPAIQAGDLIVLPAYPQVDGERGQPVPLALFAPKGMDKPFEEKNRQQVVNRLLQPEPPDGTQLKQLREGFISSNPAGLFKTPITVLTHNTVEDQLQRPTEQVGGVYSYEAIAPAEQGKPVVLLSELRLRQSLANQLSQANRQWWRQCEGEVALGRSKKDDYGSVYLRAAEPQPLSAQPDERSDNQLFVWLVSDTLLRNERLRPEPTAECLAKELSGRLGVGLKPRSSTDGRLDELVRLRRLDTWHTGWGLPRPSLVALQAGSCIVFKVEGSLNPVRLAEVEASGIGERTAEGYGQVRFNHPLLTIPPNEWPSAAATGNASGNAESPGDPPMDDATRQFARLVEIECWKQEIRRTCLGLAAEVSKRRELLGWDHRKNAPPMSQLGGLRGQVMLLQTPQNRKPILDWLDHLESNKRRSEKWPANSLKHIREFIGSDNRIWEVIDTKNWPTLTDNAAAELKRQLWAFAVRTLFDACIRAHKRDLEAVQQPKEPAHGA